MGDDTVAWLRTKINGFVSRVLIPRLEVALVWYLKVSGQRNVEKFWRSQLPLLAERSASEGSENLQTSSAQQPLFEIHLATVRAHGKDIQEISAMVNAAYVRELKTALLDADGEAEAAFSRTTPEDIERRLLTDSELQSLATGRTLVNRVLFLAVAKDGGIIGTCAATLSAPWCPSGVGSWGLLAVATPKLGVARALVHHCEEYLRIAMLERVQIEYFHVSGHPSSDSLRKWYEERLGYVCFKANSTGRSYRGNEVKGDVSFRHCEKPLDISSQLQLEKTYKKGSEGEVFEARRKRMASFLLAAK